MNYRRMSCLLGCLCLAASLVALPGCKEDPLKKVVVEGTVTFDGGPCPSSGRITFSPIEVAEGLPMRPAGGRFGVDGRYEASSFRLGDGLVPGRYQVGVSCCDASMLSGAPNDAEYEAASYVAKDYKGEELVVEVGSGRIELNIDVPLRK